MSNITRLVINALREYPSLFETRLDVLNFILNNSTYAIDPKTGDLVYLFEGETRSSPIEYDNTSIEDCRRRIMHGFTRANAEEIASSSTHDVLKSVATITHICFINGDMIENPDALSKDTRDAYLELIDHYMTTKSRAVYYMETFRTNSPSFDLNNPNIRRAFDAMGARYEWLTGETLEERSARRKALVEKLFENMK